MEEKGKEKEKDINWTLDNADGVKNTDREERKNLAKEIRSELASLSTSERWLLKSLFGYCHTDPHLDNDPNFQLKSPDSATIYVYESLWPSGLTDRQRRAEQKPFPLKNLIPRDGDLPTIFPHNLASIKEMFKTGREMSDYAQSSMCRSFQRFNKAYSHDFAVKQTGYTRLWISGSVRKKALFCRPCLYFYLPASCVRTFTPPSLFSFGFFS